MLGSEVILLKRLANFARCKPRHAHRQAMGPPAGPTLHLLRQLTMRPQLLNLPYSATTAPPHLALRGDALCALPPPGQPARPCSSILLDHTHSWPKWGCASKPSPVTVSTILGMALKASIWLAASTCREEGADVLSLHGLEIA